MDKNEKKHVLGVQSYCFGPLNMQICNVLVAVAVAVAVVVAKVPYCTRFGRRDLPFIYLFFNFYVRDLPFMVLIRKDLNV